MYTIDEINIDGFWHRANANCKFSNNVNIIIGKNGSGKTTFMNIVHAALSVDVGAIYDNEFKSIRIKLKYKGKTRTVLLTKIEIDIPPFQFIKYQISNKTYKLRAYSSEERIPIHFKRKLLEETAIVQEELSKIVSLSSLSVYRLRNGEDYEIKDRSGKRIISPIDYRLSQLMADFTQFQFELSEKVNNISSALQKEVLTSVLFSGTYKDTPEVPRNFNKLTERRKLISAYKRLKSLDHSVRESITTHIDAIAVGLAKIDNNEKLVDKDWWAFQSYVRTQNIVKMSLESERKIGVVNQPISDLFNTLREFMDDKEFFLDSGKIIFINSEGEEIAIEKLSSGEKQLLILMIETLLQKKEICIYLTDEPELSLHIEWQRKILPAIKKLNPNAQIIAATHSPEVASKYQDNIISIKKVIINE